MEQYFGQTDKGNGFNVTGGIVMKTIKTILIFFVYSVFYLNAQTFDMTASWTEITTNLFDDSYCFIRNYKLNGDTTINNLQYTKIYLNDVLYDAAIRETADHKIYAYFYSLKAERLAYDFDWETGKTICSERYEPKEEDYCVEITQINSIQLLDGNSYNYIPNIIQGIGNVSGFFTHMLPLPTDGSQYSLLCFSRNGQLVYKNSFYKSCDSCEKSTTGLSMFENDKNIIRVNCTKAGVIISFTDKKNSLQKFYLYDTAGKLREVSQINGRKQLCINGLDTGSYFYQVIGKKNKHTGSFIVSK